MQFLDDEKNFPHFEVYVRLAPSKIHGVGFFAIRKISKGTYIFYGDSEVTVWVNEKTVDSLPLQLQSLYHDFCVLREGRYGCPANFNQITPAWYLNHSQSPNVTANERLFFYALRDIEEGEELTSDYSSYSKKCFERLT